MIDFGNQRYRILSFFILIVLIVFAWQVISAKSTKPVVIAGDIPAHPSSIAGVNEDKPSNPLSKPFVASEPKRIDDKDKADNGVISYFAKLEIFLVSDANELSDVAIDFEIRTIEDYLTKNDAIKRLNSNNFNDEEKLRWGEVITRVVELRSVKLQRSLQKIEEDFKQVKENDPLAKVLR